jgi:VWFA-related protein
VLIPVEATTPEGSPVLGLHDSDFRVWEDGAEESIRYFARDDAPMSIGLLVDSSASMKDKQRRSAEAAAELLKTANSDDEFFLVEFDEGARLEVPFTTDTDLVYRGISRTRPWGRTSLFDAIHLALALMKDASNERKALIVVSDGGDNRSRLTFASVKNDVIESEVPIYALGIFDPATEPPDSREEAGGPDLLSRLAELTGGRHFPVQLADLPAISATVGELLRNRYLLGYTPGNAKRDGTYRRITVELAGADGDPVRLRYRRGYYAPSR